MYIRYFRTRHVNDEGDEVSHGCMGEGHTEVIRYLCRLGACMYTGRAVCIYDQRCMYVCRCIVLG